LSSPWILVPLGNPGAEYAQTRHNLGRLMLQRWLAARDLRPEPLKLFQTGTLYAISPGIRALVAATYMNLSGQVCSEARGAGIPLDRLMVIFDDKDLPLGTGRFRRKGRPNGHNGLASIMEHLGSEDLGRLRLGIGPFLRPLHEYVLGDWTGEEQAILDRLDSPFARVMEHLAHTDDPDILAGKINQECVWSPGPEADRQ